MIKNHYGVWVDSEEPTTGVIHNCSSEWLLSELHNGIDLDWEEFMKTDPTEEEQEYYESYNPTILMGDWKKDDDGLYEPDKTGEYAAIVGEIYTQVVWSIHTARCALCSPCYPGQGDLDSSGEYLAYTLPE